MTTSFPRPATAEDSVVFSERLLQLLADAVCQEIVGGAAGFYRRIVRLASEAMGAVGTSLFLVESDGEGLIEVAVHDPRELRVPGRRFGRGEGVAGAALASGRIEWHSAEVPHVAFVSTQSRVGNLIALPLIAPGQPVHGVLCAHGLGSGAIFEEVRELMESWRVALSHGIRMVRAADNLQVVNRRLREENERVVKLRALAGLVVDGAGMEEVAEAILREAGRLYGLERSVIVVEEEEGARILAVRGLEDRCRPGAVHVAGSRPGDPVLSCIDEVLAERRMVVRSEEIVVTMRSSRGAFQALLGLPLSAEAPGGMPIRGAVLFASGWGDAPRVDDLDPAPALCFLDDAFADLLRSRRSAQAVA